MWLVLRTLLLLAIVQNPLLQGRVVDGTTKQPVAGALVSVGTARTTADAAGRFAIAVPPGPSTVDITAAGFLTQHLTAFVAAGMTPLEIALTPAPTVREEVTVFGSSGAAVRTPAAIDVAPAAVLAVAGAADNIFKALQTLPGVNAVDDFGSRLSVRGGGPDQNLTVMDGVEIHNPFRLFGLTSAFNPEIIDRFELTAGGFDATHGDRLSSLLAVENRAGTTTQSLAGSAALSLTDANAVVEGRLPGGAQGSWLVTGRRTYYDLVADRLTDTHLPKFDDLQSKVVWKPRTGQRVSLFGLRSRERTDASLGSEGDDHIRLGDVSKNDLVSLGYSVLLRGRLNLNTVGGWYDYRDALDVDGSVSNGARRSNAADPDAEQRSAIVFTRDLGVLDRSVRSDAQWQAGTRHLLDFGAEMHSLRTQWAFNIKGDTNDSVANGSSVLGGAALPLFLQSGQTTSRAGAWLQDRISFGAHARLVAGLRLDHSGVSRDTIVSPRLSVDIELTPRMRFRAATGQYTQSPGYEKLLQSDYFVDLSSSVGARLSSERALHALATIDRTLTPAVTLRVEAYAKRFSDLLVGRLETPAETAARVARYDFPASFASSVPVAPQITTQPVNGASGLGYGLDVYLEKRQRTAGDRLSGWMSYTWSKATVDSYGVQRPFDYDRRHALSLVSTLALRRRIDLGATLRVASGFPATLPIGVRVASEEAADGSGRLVPALDKRGRPIWTVDFGDTSHLSRSRLPIFARLDLRLTFKPKTPTGHWLVYVEVLNATKRKNVSSLSPELQYDPASDRPRITYSSDNGLPLLPSFGMRWKF